MIKKDPGTNIKSLEADVDDMERDPYDHTYYKNYSIAGFKPIKVANPLLPTFKPNTKTNMNVKVGNAEALSVAAAYILPSSCRKVRDEKCRDTYRDYDIDSCAEIIENLQWEALGITGFQSGVVLLILVIPIASGIKWLERRYAYSSMLMVAIYA